jgi:hypothetical protein
MLTHHGLSPLRYIHAATVIAVRGESMLTLDGTVA